MKNVNTFCDRCHGFLEAQLVWLYSIGKGRARQQCENRSQSGQNEPESIFFHGTSIVNVETLI